MCCFDIFVVAKKLNSFRIVLHPPHKSCDAKLTRLTSKGRFSFYVCYHSNAFCCNRVVRLVWLNTGAMRRFFVLSKVRLMRFSCSAWLHGQLSLCSEDSIIAHSCIRNEIKAMAALRIRFGGGIGLIYCVCMMRTIINWDSFADRLLYIHTYIFISPDNSTTASYKTSTNKNI